MINYFGSRRRPLLAAAALMSFAFAPLGCKRHQRRVLTTEEAPMLASVVATADPHLSRQLVTGFYGVEQNAWRWTTGRFSVVLRPPASAATKGATLEMKFAVPEASINKLKAVTLSAYINGTPLPPETYSKPGQFTFSRDIAPGTLSGDVARVDFSVDKTMPPTAADGRELGVVVSMVGFQSK